MSSLNFKSNYLIFVLLATLLITLSLFAQDQKRPPMFKQDFVKDRNLRPAIKPTIPPFGYDTDLSDEEDDSSDEKITNEKITVTPLPNDNTKSFYPSSTDDSVLSTKGLKVFEVGIILDTVDIQRMKNTLKSFINYLITSDMHAGEIILYGGESRAPALMELFVQVSDIEGMNGFFSMRELIEINSKMQWVDKFPEMYKEVKRAPTYLINTEKGMIILDGVNKPIDTYLKGRYFTDFSVLRGL
jgi:hypothetical protein